MGTLISLSIAEIDCRNASDHRGSGDEALSIAAERNFPKLARVISRGARNFSDLKEIGDRIDPTQSHRSYRRTKRSRGAKFAKCASWQLNRGVSREIFRYRFPAHVMRFSRHRNVLDRTHESYANTVAADTMHAKLCAEHKTRRAE